jgi:hypothetical protein
MSFVVTLEDFRPSPRYDSLPWTEARIEEATTALGPWVALETITLSPVDVDPSSPAYRDFTTELGTAADLWYRIVFLDGTGDEALPTYPVQNTSATQPVYATSGELARILKIRNPSDEQRSAMERVLIAAAGEIDAEINLAADAELESWQLALAAQVNLDRAADLWRHTESIPGVTGLLGDEVQAALPGRYSWERYAQRLAPLKNQWGIA